MFAQTTMNRNHTQTIQAFRERVEKPVFKGLVISTVIGTVLGAYITFSVLIYSMSLATLAGAMLAGAAVGGNAGLLVYGLFDVVFNGRLEADADLVEDAEENELSDQELQIDEMRGQEEYGYTLQKAS